MSLRASRPRRPRRLLHAAALALASGLAMFFLGAPALAQIPGGGMTINVIQENSFPRLNATNGAVTKRPLTLEPEGVSLQDCLEDQRIAFPLQLAGYVPQSTLEAWAGLSGADCGVQINRQSGTQVCWQIAEGIPLEPTPRPAISVRKIMSGVLDPKALDESASICGRIDLTTISVQFLYFAPGLLATPAAKKELQVRVDTVGPDAPAGVSTLPGNTRIRISFGGLGEGGLTQFTGVRAYCDTSVAGGPVAEAGTTRVCTDSGLLSEAGDADADPDAGAESCVDVPNEAGTSGSGVCKSTNLAPPDGGRITPNEDFDRKFLCGSLIGNTGSALIADQVGGKPLMNFREYAVAVAATDQFGNVGPLSPVFCETPEPTTDFWETYKNSGGAAGGGLCAVEGGAGVPVSGLAVSTFFGLAVVSTLRRRYKQSVRAKKTRKS